MTCQHWLPGKNRHCRQQASPDTSYCPMHGNLTRIPCPIDPSHTIDPSQIEQHRKRCPAYLRQCEQQGMPYYSEHCCVLPSDPQEDYPSALVHSVLLQRILDWWHSSVYQHTREIDSLETLGSGTTEPLVNHSTKHAIQIDAIVDILSAEDKQREDSERAVLGIEMGAGKGTLSAKLHERHPDWFHLLVDIRRNFKNKAEKKSRVPAKLHSATEHTCFRRITIDIAHLRLRAAINHEFPPLQALSPRVVVYAKHLCGAALDLTLACVVQGLNPSGELSRVVLASCCHHRCQWDSFVGRTFLRQVLGQCTPEDFSAICRMTSWATSRNTLDSEATRPDGTKYPRHVVGMICKYLLDEARRTFLSESFPQRETRIEEFIDYNLSPENRLLLLW